MKKLLLLSLLMISAMATAWAVTDGVKYEPLGEMDAAFLSSETAGGFTGVYLALYAQGRQNGGCADFDWFEYKD
jgi:beta-xylosidase